MKLLQIHELALLLPELSRPEFEALTKDIEENGLLEPIVLYEGKILDGRHRWKACQSAGLTDYAFETAIEYKGADAARFVFSKNIARRHLTTSQRGMIAHQLRGKFSQNPNKKPDGKFAARSEGMSATEAATLLNVSERTVREAGKIDREASPKVKESIINGHLTLHEATTIIQQPVEQQDKLASMEKADRKKAAESWKAILLPKKFKPDKEQIEHFLTWLEKNGFYICSNDGKEYVEEPMLRVREDYLKTA